MRFSPSCDCCTPPPQCSLCDVDTSQEEYSLTFWGGEAEESTIIVSSLGHPCWWNYIGVIGDIAGISDDGNGTCDDTTQLSVIVRLAYKDPFFGGLGWYWELKVIIECNVPQSLHRSRIEAFNVISETDPAPEYGQTQSCDLSVGVDFINPVSYNYYIDWVGSCDWPPEGIEIGCLDCKDVGDIYTCNYPDGVFCHMENN